MSCHSDCNSVSTNFPCCLPKGPLKEGFLALYLTILFVAGISGTTSAMRVIFFGKCLKFNTEFRNAKEISEKIFSFFR